MSFAAEDAPSNRMTASALRLMASSRAAVAGTILCMSGVRARVQNGRLIVDDPTTLPEGTVLDLVCDDEGARATSRDGDAELFVAC